MKSLITSVNPRRTSVVMSLAAAALALPISGAGAQTHHALRTGLQYGPPPYAYQSAYGPPALSRWDRARFDHSGTRGREGLGASPMHPEGPGNVSD